MASNEEERLAAVASSIPRENELTPQLSSADSSPDSVRNLSGGMATLQSNSESEDIGNQHRTIEPSRPKVVCSPKVNYSEFSVHVLTWNIASTPPSPADIESLFLPQESIMINDLYNTTDIIAVGLQEAYQSVQEAISSNVPLIGRDQLVDDFSTFLARKGFARLSSCRLLGILTLVFVKRPLLCYIRNVETSTTKTGFSGMLGNKGASSIRFVLGDLSICFTNCHLCPHLENNDRRVLELKDIFERQTFSDVASSELMDHDVVVLFGDLNFRLEGRDFHEVVDGLVSKRVKNLIKSDQLRIEQIRGEKSPSQLYSFMEMPLEFLPSYKYAPGTDDFHDGGKGRAPAWTDRILWRTHERRLPQITDSEPHAVLKPVYYGMHIQPRISDHKAVSGGLKLSVDISDFSPMIIFRLHGWVASTEGVISFDVIANTEVSMFDWIGLYPADFASVERDYVFWAYSPAKNSEKEDKVYSKELSANQVPENPGLYVLVYKSFQYGCVLGMSPIFRIEPCNKSEFYVESSVD